MADARLEAEANVLEEVREFIDESKWLAFKNL